MNDARSKGHGSRGAGALGFVKWARGDEDVLRGSFEMLVKGMG